MYKRRPREQWGPVGAPTKFKPEFVPIAAKMAYLGATDADLAEAFDVTIKQIKFWKSRYPEFGASLKMGKKEADERMERSLYERGVGYTYDAVKIFLPYGSKEPIYAPYIEHIPPDTTAAIFWLKNRDPARWRDAWQIENVTGKYLVSDKPLDEATWIRERGATDLDLIDVTPAVPAD